MTGAVAVITIVHGRADHLARQDASLAAGSRRPDHRVVVAMDDPGVASHTACLVRLPAHASGLPLAAARNAGARRARELGAETLVFLDVDVLAGPDLVAGYADAVATEFGRLWCGPVTYLEPPGPHGYDVDGLADLDAPHPGRPAPAPGRRVDVAPGGQRSTDRDWTLFWSLSFALRTTDFERVGGFCERYVGYGGEDTDFAAAARAAGLGLTWLGSARGYHQHHPVSRPPVEHVADIVRNARIFHDRWGWWPMSGWLAQFERLGLAGRDATDGWVAR